MKQFVVALIIGVLLSASALAKNTVTATTPQPLPPVRVHCPPNAVCTPPPVPFHCPPNADCAPPPIQKPSNVAPGGG
jgi:hypothetical protein